MHRTSRMTLAEVLAVVIVIAVIAVFLHAQVEQREADRRSVALNGLAGMLRSSAALAHSVWISGGGDAARISLQAGQTIEIDLQTGYPRASDGGLADMIPALDGIAGRQENGAYVFSVVGVPAARCNVTYVTGTVAGAPPRVTVRTNANGGDCT